MTRLNDSVFKYAEILLFEPGNELVSFLQDDAHVHGDYRDIDVKGIGSHAGRVLDLGLDGSGWLIGRGLFAGHGDGA